MHDVSTVTRMTRKTAAEIEREARELQAKAIRLRAEERKEERRTAGYIQRLLGVYLERQMRTDPALRARVASDMRGFCTRPRDRELFKLDEAQTYFDRLGVAAEKKEDPKPERTAPVAVATKPQGGPPADKPVTGLPPPALGTVRTGNGHTAAPAGTPTSIDGARSVAVSASLQPSASEP